MRIRFIHFIFLFLLFNSCKKDVVIDGFTIGDYDNMSVTYFDTLFMTHDVDFDVNKDGLADLKLVSEIWGSPGTGYHPRSHIQCLNSAIEFLGYFTNDTLFVNHNLRIFKDLDGTIKINDNFNYTCHRLSVFDSIDLINQHQFKISPKNNGDVIKKGLTFKTSTINLVDDSYGYSQGITGYGKDTIARRYYNYYNDCNAFPMGQDKFIAFKLTENNTVKYGWLKVKIIDKFKILVSESAIQIF